MPRVWGEVLCGTRRDPLIFEIKNRREWSVVAK